MSSTAYVGRHQLKRAIRESFDRTRARWRTRAALNSQVTMAATLFAGALFLRVFAIVSSRNLNVDEATYTDIGESVAHGQGVSLYGVPFNLHPPVVLLTFGAVIKLFHLDGSESSIIFGVRNVSAFFGALTVAGFYLLARRVRVPALPALTASVLLALDPFGIQYDTITLLEAETEFFLLCAVLLIALLIREWPARARNLIVGGAALFTALAVCSKETFGLTLMLTLAILFATSVIPRRETAIVIGGGIFGFVAWVGSVAASGGLQAWWRTQTSGFSRLIGTSQLTGFNAPTTRVSLASRVLANLDYYAITYVVLILGGVCSVLLLVTDRVWRRERPPRSPLQASRVLVGAWAFSSCLYLVYATLIGSIEEQMYYIVLAPCLLALVTWVASFMATQTFNVGRIIAAATLVAILINAAIWVRVHTTDDNIYNSFLKWEAVHIPSGSKIAATEDIGTFVIQGAILGQWNTPREFIAEKVDYVLVNTKLVEQGYGRATPDLLAYLRATATLTYSVSSSASGTLMLFDVRAITKAGS